MFQLKLDKYFHDQEEVAIAVSGGPDSLALLFAAYKHCKLIAITVDHALRLESAQEAQYVAWLCSQYGIAHHILTICHQSQESMANFTQEKARLKRYELLTNFCKQHDITKLLTAHQFQDQIEHLLIRLSRGSNVLGLTMPSISKLNGITVIRPLLLQTKDDCKAFLSAQKIAWVEDPSNQKPSCLRNKLRPIADQYLQIIAQDRRILTAFDNLRNTKKQIILAARHFMNRSVVISELGYSKLVDLEKYMTLSQDVRCCLLAHLLQHTSGISSLIRQSSIQKLDLKIISGEFFRMTLNHVMVTKYKGFILFYRELGKNKILSMGLQNDLMWDNRYQVSVQDTAGNFMKNTYTIDTISLQEYFELAKRYQVWLSPLSKIDIQNICLSLPVIRHLEKVIAVPHIDCDRSLLPCKITFTRLLVDHYDFFIE